MLTVKRTSTQIDWQIECYGVGQIINVCSVAYIEEQFVFNNVLAYPSLQSVSDSGSLLSTFFSWI